MSLEQNEPESEIEITIKKPIEKEESLLNQNEIDTLNEQDTDNEPISEDDMSPQKKKAAIKKAEREAKAAAKKAEREAKAAAKKAEREAKDAAKKAAQEKKAVEVELPAYFTTKYPDYQEEKKAEQEAFRWFLGLDNDLKPLANSYSAKITYVGPKRVTSKIIRKAKRAIIPNMGNWKVSKDTVRFFKKQEQGALIKDPAFIKEALSTTNYKVRIIIDQKINKKEIKSEHFARSDARVLKLKPRLRRDMIAMGQQPPLHKGEAAQFLQELNANPDVRKDLYTEDQRKWLQKKIKEDETEK